MRPENVARFKAGLEEIYQIYDLLNKQALQDRITYKSNPHEGLRRAKIRGEFFKEILAIPMPDGIEVLLNSPDGPTAEAALMPYMDILEKYGFRKVAHA